MATDPTQLLVGLLNAPGLIGQQTQENMANQQQIAASQQQMQLVQAKLASAQQDQQAQAQFQQDVSSHQGVWTPQDIFNLSVKYPDQAKQFSEAAKAKDDAQRQSDLGFFGGVYSAAKNNKPDLAIKQLQARSAAERSAGMDTSDIDGIVQDLQAGKPEALQELQNFSLGQIYAHDPDQFAKVFDLNADNRNHFSTTATGDIYDQRTGEITGHSSPKPPEYQYDATNHRWLLKPGSEGGDPSSSGDTSVPRSVRNNNPGNLKASPFTRKLPGFQGVDSGGFAIFDSPDNGTAAQGALLGNYIDRGYNTVAKIIGRWAPPTDNNDTGSYIRNVAKALNVNPGDTISKASIPKLQAAIARVEGGPGPSSGIGRSSGPPSVVDVPTGQGGAESGYVPGTSVGGLTAAAIDAAAGRYNLTGKLPPSLGRGGAAQQAILSRAAQLSGGQSAGDLLAGQAGRTADTTALNHLEKTAANVSAFERTALRNGAQALRLSTNVGNGNLTVFNRWMQAGKKATGDGDVAAFQAAIDTFANEYAKVTSSVTGGGVTSDSAREHAHQIINGAQSPDQLIKVMGALRVDMANRSRGLETQRQSLLNRIKGGQSAPSGFRIVGVRRVN